MLRREFLSGVIGSAAGSAALFDPDPDPSRRTYRNPVFGEVFADPTVVRADDGTFYAYATYNDWGQPWRRPLVPIARSETLVEWERAGEAFAEKPGWTGDDGLWAPDIARLAGRYVLYYAVAQFGERNPAIGVAVSDSPAGPFEDRGPLLRSAEIGVPNTIDPELLVDDGVPYLFFGSHRGIYGVRLAPGGLSLAGEPFQIAGRGVEAACLVRRNGRYYFFGSRGTCCEGAESTYRVVVGRAPSLRGPYRNRAGEPLSRAPGTTILRGDDTFAGPGHNAIVRDDDGADWIVYHAYERMDPWAGPIPRRVLMIDRLRWADGWPTVAGRSPSERARRPATGSGGLFG
ncbi:family 43 glycosylhydrolase [Halegenticoccus soli]|uniref:family 43 glycosylhydrolase n=1 Tax=Halegenticoccus soli TaxID=1985678 RepID=UPI00130429DA|nr:family 43 glycosylhydrolase [Halegenticoccus soli]